MENKITNNNLPGQDSMRSRSRLPSDIPPPIEPAGILTGLKVRPIVIGVVVDYVSTLICQLVYVSVLLGEEIFNEENLSEESINKVLTSPEHLLIFGLIGTLCVVLGGYVAGRVAKSAEVKHGAFVALVSLILATLEQVISGVAVPLPQWYQAAGYIISVPAGALGGYIAQSQRESWGIKRQIS